MSLHIHSGKTEVTIQLRPKNQCALPYMREWLSKCTMRCENCGELLLESRSEILDKMQNGIKEQITSTCGNCGQICNKNVVAK